MASRMFPLIAMTAVWAPWALLVCAPPADAAPDLRVARQAGPITVYPDDGRRNLFYYPPGELAIATREGGAPDIHLLHARYTGSVVTRDQGAALARSIFTVHVVMNGPSPADLAAARRALASAAGSVELRPLPIRRVESAIVYAPVAGGDASASTPLPSGHFEAADTAAPKDGYWTERVYTLGLGPEDAQLLSAALERGAIALSVGYAFLADGIGPDQPFQELTGSPAVVEQLRKLIAPPGDGHDGTRNTKTPHLVRAGAVGVTADLSRWPDIVRRIDINESAPPGYAALDVYCYDFNQGGESPLYEKQVEIEAAGVGGRPVTLTTSFTRSQPDLYARSLHFPVAVRLDRPYRFRIVEIAQDGTSRTTRWRDRSSWADLLDVTEGGVR